MVGAPPASTAPPVLHWGSAGRAALDAGGRRNTKLFVIATRGCGLRALGMAVGCEGLRKEGVLVLDEICMRGSALLNKEPFDGGGVCTLWGSSGGDLLILSLSSAVNSWRGHAIAAALTDAICAERVVILDELPLRHCAIETDVDEDWALTTKMIPRRRQVPTSEAVAVVPAAKKKEK